MWYFRTQTWLLLCSFPQTSHNHLLLVSTAEILFNNSKFALLAGQGMFVRSQVTSPDTEGLLDRGGEDGFVESFLGGGGRKKKQVGTQE